jgi:hypothetical protein
VQIDVDRAAFDAGNRYSLSTTLSMVKDDGIDDRPIVAVCGANDANGPRHKGQRRRPVN